MPRSRSKLSPEAEESLCLKMFNYIEEGRDIVNTTCENCGRLVQLDANETSYCGKCRPANYEY